MPFSVHDGTVICWPCHRAERDTPARTPAPGFRSRPAQVAGDLKRPAGWKRDYGCRDCRAQHPRYTYGRCDRCALAAVFDHLTPSAEARRVLAPLRDALLTGPRPASSLSWLRKNPGLLTAMGTGTIRVDHAALDALPRSRTTETICGPLVATGCLPTRNTYAADFQRWLTDHLATAEAADHRLILHEYGTWRLLPRIHRPRDSRPQTYSTFQYAKTRIRAAQSFLTWLAQHDTPLAAATQTDVDDFLSHNPQHLGALEAFLRWTTRTRKSRKLACHKPRSDQPKPALTAEQRWQLLRRVLHDNGLEPADRLMGALILLRTDWIEYTKTDEDDDLLTPDKRLAVTAPFGQTWPTPVLSHEPVASADEMATEYAGVFYNQHPQSRLGLVAAVCGADALTAAGWDGPVNYENDTAKFSAVVSDWERRFGARVVAVGFGTLHLSVAAPPTDTQEALLVAAEHFAFCPDNIWQGPRPCTLAAYAERIVGMNSWDFWWD